MAPTDTLETVTRLLRAVYIIGHNGLWRFAEKARGIAYWNVRFQFFRTVTNDTQPKFEIPEILSWERLQS